MEANRKNRSNTLNLFAPNEITPAPDTSAATSPNGSLTTDSATKPPTGDGLPETTLPALSDIEVHRTEPFRVPGLNSLVLPMPVFSVRLQRTGTHLTREVTCPSDAARVACEMLEDRDRECLLVLALSASGRLVAANIAHVGGLDSSICSGREIYRFAILAVAKSIIVVHNHPSGRTTPSSADIEVTKLLRAAGDTIGIPLRDHIITGYDGEYTSLAERGLMI